MNITPAAELLTSNLNYITLSPEATDAAKQRFGELQQSGVIRQNCCFDDTVWYTTDQYANVGLHFKFNSFSFRSNYQDVFGCPLDTFVTYTKAFVISLFGKNALASIQSALLDLRHIIATPRDQVYGAAKDLHIALPHICEDFISQLPNAEESEELQRLADVMDIYADANLSDARHGARALADFESYFLFDDRLRHFWKSDLSPETRLFYYPLYLWWMITAVIPLRPREFLLTERNCLSSRDGVYYLRLRRNQIKGSNREISYKLSGDYKVDTYKIPQYLGEVIQKYIDLTNDFEATEIDTLFRTDSHYEHWGQSKHSNSRYLTYMNMRTILRYFYTEILHDCYGLNIVCVDDGQHIQLGEISRIHLGDARHIALISLMESGGTPMLAMYLAGHSNDDMAAHYYSNVSRLIDCRTHIKYHQMLSGDREFQIVPAYTAPLARHCSLLADGGRCYSDAYHAQEITDCVDAIGPNGEIAYCPSCTYYRGPGVSRFGADDKYRRRIEDDVVALKAAIALVRSERGATEDIGQAILKLQSSTLAFERYKIEKYMHEQED